MENPKYETETQPVVAKAQSTTDPSQVLLPADPKPSTSAVVGKPTELSAQAIFKAASPAVVRIEVRDRSFKLIGHGSGFLVSEDDLVATNHPVIQSAYFAHVVFPDGSKFPVEGVAASEPAADLALLKLKGRNFQALTLADDALPAVGTKVYAIGNPKGLTNSLSDGLVSGHRQLDATSFIQTTAPISPGSSGGPLFSEDGRVVGVTTASMRGGQNWNLVVPTRLLKDVLKKDEASCRHWPAPALRP